MFFFLTSYKKLHTTGKVNFIVLIDIMNNTFSTKIDGNILKVFKNGVDDVVLPLPASIVRPFLTQFVFRPHERTLLKVMGFWIPFDNELTILYIDLSDKTVSCPVERVQQFFRSKHMTADLILDNLNLEENFLFTLINDEKKVVHISHPNLHYFMGDISELGTFDVAKDDLSCYL